MQRNWIGRSEGAEVDFTVDQHGDVLRVFTTRPDTLFGATFMVLSPEHPFVEKITTSAQKKEVESYRRTSAQKSDLERTDLAKDKTGVFTGAYAINPVNSAKIPIWIADYVLMSYGTGAIMAVPAHDERDYEFAQKFDLEIVDVIKGEGKAIELFNKKAGKAIPTQFVLEGETIHSEFLNGLSSKEAKARIIDWLEEQGKGKRTVNYKLRDWLFSRQRYWGEPFPVVWKDEKHEGLREDDLPLLLPEMEDFQPTPEGLAPLTKAREWLNLSNGARRETNTMPQWAGSCWYYLRYCDSQNDKAPVGKDADQYWMKPSGVDLYVGGAEHAVLHLLYARFWHKVLYDAGVVSTLEPFHKLVNQGIILGEDNQKMSKSIGNVVNPDDVLREFGADALRLFEMFMGPLEQAKPWSMKGLEGVYRFLGRVWRLVNVENQEGQWVRNEALKDVAPTSKLLKTLHQTIKKVGEDIEGLRFNTAIAEMMVLTNELTQLEQKPKSVIEKLVLLLAPFAPHIAEEIWRQLGHKESLSHEPWPVYNPELLVESEVEIVIQVNGKVRDRVLVPANLDQPGYESLVREHASFNQWTSGKSVKKVIAVPQKLVNLVVG
jgi:leucyl-tRNA synthetase